MEKDNFSKEDKIIQLAIERVNKTIGDFEPENICWLHGQETDVDEGVDLCYKCAKKKAKELTKKIGKKVEVDGGYSGAGQENDTISVCDDCGELLSYSLTEYGVKSELDHFLSKDTKIDLYNKREAYEIEEVLSCYNDYDQHKKRIIELAKKVLKHNFWYKINNPTKLQHCAVCGRKQHIWYCETYGDLTHFKDNYSLTDEECIVVNQICYCRWHKGAVRRKR